MLLNWSSCIILYIYIFFIPGYYAILLFLNIFFFYQQKKKKFFINFSISVNYFFCSRWFLLIYMNIILFLLFLKLEASLLWYSNFFFSKYSLDLFQSLIYVLIIFLFYFLLYIKSSVYLLEYSFIFFVLIFWFYYLFFATNIISIVICLELVSLAIFVIAAYSVLLNSNLLHISKNTISNSLNQVWEKESFIFFINLFWVSAFISTGFFLLLSWASLEFKYLDYSLWEIVLCKSLISYLLNFSLKTLVFYNQNLIFIIIYLFIILFIKLGLAPFVQWKLNSFSHINFVFFIFYSLFFFPILFIYVLDFSFYLTFFYGFIIKKFLEIVLSLSILSLILFFLFQRTFKMFLVLSTALTSNILFFLSISIDSYIKYLFYLLWVKLFWINYIFGIGMLTYIFFINNRLSFITNLNKFSIFDRSIIVFNILSLSGLPPFFSFIIKFNIFNFLINCMPNYFFFFLFLFFISIYFYFYLYKSVLSSLFIDTISKRFEIILYTQGLQNYKELVLISFYMLYYLLFFGCFFLFDLIIWLY